MPMCHLHSLGALVLLNSLVCLMLNGQTHHSLNSLPPPRVHLSILFAPVRVADLLISRQRDFKSAALIKVSISVLLGLIVSLAVQNVNLVDCIALKVKLHGHSACLLHLSQTQPLRSAYSTLVAMNACDSAANTNYKKQLSIVTN